MTALKQGLLLLALVVGAAILIQTTSTGEHTSGVGEHATGVGELATGMGELATGMGELATGMGEHATAVGDNVYTIGVVPQFDSRKILSIWRPILDEIEKQSGIRLRLQGSPSIPLFEKEFQAGKFDFAYMNPYHMLIAHNGAGYNPLVRDHGRQLHGILVVRKDSPIKALEELQGKIVAFPAPNALGASLMMRAELQGEKKINIEPSYVKSHTSVYLNVVTGMATAGGGVQKTLSQQPTEIRDQLRIIHRTTKVNPHPLAVHPRVPAEVAQQVQAAILAIGQSDSGKVLLSKIPMKQVGEAVLEDYLPLRKLGLESFYVE